MLGGKQCKANVHCFIPGWREAKENEWKKCHSLSCVQVFVQCILGDPQATELPHCLNAIKTGLQTEWYQNHRLMKNGHRSMAEQMLGMQQIPGSIPSISGSRFSGGG